MSKSLLIIGKDFDLLGSEFSEEDLEKRGIDIFTFGDSDFIIGSVLIDSENSLEPSLYLTDLQRKFKETSENLLKAGIDSEGLKLIARFV